MDQMTKEQQKKLVRNDLKSMSYDDLIDLKIYVRDNKISIGDISPYEYETLITSAMNRHKDCPWDKTGTYNGKYAKKRIYL